MERILGNHTWNKPDKEAREELPDLPSGSTTPGKLYTDYIL
jgi:hypothetical protein